MMRQALLPILAASILVTGCASGGGVPRPQPFPGAQLPSTPTDGATAEAPEADGALVATALSLRGTPYRNGGSDPSRGFDCSGFVQWVFTRHGTALPREVRDQFEVGERVERDQVRPGDLVFFETVTRGPSHVGIALGGGRFVHAPSSRGVVRVEGYTNGYWAARWVGARRIAVPSSSGELARR